MNQPEFKATPNVRVRPAAPGDIHLLSYILPKGFKMPDHTRYLVAETDPGGEYVGGAYVFISPLPGNLKHALFQMTYLQDEPIPGLNTLLLRACIVLARKEGAQTMAFDGMISEDTAAEKFLQDNGFKGDNALIDYEMELTTFVEASSKACRLLERRNKPPAEARIIGFNEAQPQPALNLLYRCFGITPHLSEHTFLENISTVVQFGARIVGVILGEDAKGVLLVPHTGVDEEFRQGWVTPFLWRRFGQQAIEKGYKVGRFRTSEEQFRRLANFAKRFSSVRHGNQYRYSLALKRIGQ